MKFRYYITDLYKGSITGTNDKQIALGFAACEDYFVVDSHNDEWLQSNGSVLPVEPA